MILMVRTPEDIFREKNRDIYVIRSNGSFGDTAADLTMIKTWIRQELSGTHMEFLGPSEHSGVIEGANGRDLYVDFSRSGLAAFCHEWERNNVSIDPRFQCYSYSYDRWYQEHGRFVPTQEKPVSLGPIAWWFSSLGFVAHQFNECSQDTAFPETHPAHHKDIWNNAIEVIPELATENPAKLTYGEICSNPNGSPSGCAFFPPLTPGAKYVPSIKDIRNWFSLSDRIPVIQDPW